MNEIAKDILMHYGVGKLDGAPGRGSGRYPLGSGENPNQRNADFIDRVELLKKNSDHKLTEKEICEALGMSSTEYRDRWALARNEKRRSEREIAVKMRKEGATLDAIAKELGYKNDSSVRALLNADVAARKKKAQVTADFLKEVCDKKGMIDVGAGVELELGCSTEKLRQALDILKDQGYEVWGGGVPQATNPGQQTNLKVLCPPGTPHKDIYNYANINSVIDYDRMLTNDGDAIRRAFEYPSSLDSSRLQICYAEDGGKLKDGTIEIRRGLKDLNLGNSNYAQVRIMVDGTHYLKGMALYSDNLPPGVDVVFNTNKTKDVPVMGPKDNSVLKPIKADDPDNPFGALIKERGGQMYYDDPNGKYTDPLTGKKQSLSPINKTREEGDWNEWKDRVPAQFLSKQSLDLINRQLGLAIDERKIEYDEICSLTQPTVRKALLKDFADECDKDSVHLQAASLPRQKYQVILPLTTIKDDEVYAPNFKDGESVALIRYPHGGRFEIPICKVNNKDPEGSKVIGPAGKDVIGISSKTAGILSGADFDGDTVMVIPTGRNVKILNKDSLPSLNDFDPKIEYGPGSTDKPYKRMKNTQNEMGKITNLITDMTILGATDDELARAVKHSMVVIDAEKHGLDYKRSYKDNGIAELKKKYQGHIVDGKYSEGAATLISRAKSQTSVLKRQGQPYINQKGKPWYDPDKPEGSLVYKTADPDKLTYVDKNTGKTVTRTQKSSQMAEVSDANLLVSEARNPVELAYANYANSMKRMAETARMEYLNTKETPYNSSAKEVYKNEVNSLDAKLRLAKLNQPRERLAQLYAKSVVMMQEQANPDMKAKDKKKAGQLALTEARNRLNAKRKTFPITDKEWEAITAGAISKTMLSEIVLKADKDRLRQLASPHKTKELSPSQVSRIKALARSKNYTNSQIADALGISLSTVSKYVNS